MSETKPSKMRVKQIYTYPIKSLRGTTPQSLSATYTGFTHDRRFMLFCARDDKNMHVAHYPEMCLFTTSLISSSSSSSSTPDTIEVTYTKSHPFDQPDQSLKDPDSKLLVPLQPDVQALGLGEVEVTMHSSPVVGFDMGSEYNEWFNERFGYQVQLLYIGANRRKILGNMPPNVAGRQLRSDVHNSNKARTGGGNNNGWLGSLSSAAGSLLNAVSGNNNSDENKENEEVSLDGVDAGISFADCAPYLVISTKSWENAQKRLPEGEVMDISKFRPNIIVEGATEEFEEDFWAELNIVGSAAAENRNNSHGEGRIGVKIILTQNCARCNSLNVDYDTGKVGAGEAGKILKKLQSDRRVDPGAKWSPIFGRYGFLGKLPAAAGSEGEVAAAEIRVGDEVTVTRRNEARSKFEWPNLSTN